MIISKRQLLLGTFVFSTFACFAQTAKNIPTKKINSSKPNIVLIYADDMGYGDVGYLGATDIRTPNIDELAHQGVSFTQGYVSASVCGPSRCGLLTGVYQQRYGMGENTPGEKWLTGEFPMQGIPTSQPIISEILKLYGYHNKAVGKWHVGFDMSLRPLQRGFDEYYGFLNGSHDYYKADMNFGKNAGTWPMFKNNDIVKFEGYTTEVFTDEAINFIKKNENEPFFVYVAYNAVHHPWEVPDTYVNRLAHISDKDRRLFGGMILAMDDGIGHIIQTLKDKGVYENTIVIFISDNGSPKGQNGNMSNTGGLRGWKGDSYEGGIKVPFIIRWPGILPSGTTYKMPVSTLDIVPTIASFLGTKKNINGLEFDGVDLLPFLTGKKGAKARPHEIMYWRRDDDYAIRMGDWKLEWNDGDGSKRPMLFNLSNDKNEKTDLIKENPQMAVQLQNMFDLWDINLPASIFWGAPINRKKNN